MSAGDKTWDTKNSFVPFIFFGRRFELPCWQSLLAWLTTVFLFISCYFSPYYVLKFCFSIAENNLFVMPFAIWLMESVKNYFFILVFGCKGDLQENFEDRKYCFTPLFFFGKTYDILWWQSYIITFVTLYSYLNYLFYGDRYVEICLWLAAKNPFLLPLVMWSIEVVRNYLLVHILRIK